MVVEVTGTKDYFYVEPLSRHTDEQISHFLNELGDAAFTVEKRNIKVGDKKVLGVYEVPHAVLTKISQTEHRYKVRMYVQKGEGEVRIYEHFSKRLRRVARSKSVKTAARVIKNIE